MGRQYKVVFELVKILESSPTLGSSDVIYEGTVNGSSTGKSPYFDGDVFSGNVLDGAAFTKTFEVPEDSSIPVSVTFGAWRKSIVSSDDPIDIFTVTIDAGEKQSFASYSNAKKFLLFWRIEPPPCDPPVSLPPPAVSREHRQSQACTSLDNGIVEIGIAVRGFWDESIEPSILVQHVDMTLPTKKGNHRTLVGFFGDPNVVVEKRALGYLTGGQLNDIKGIIRRDDDFQDKEHYIDADVAQSKDVVTMFCTLEVNFRQAKLIDDQWSAWKKGKIPEFNGLGRNCSNRAALALKAGLVMDYIDGLDTPYNLYRTLKRLYGDKLKCTPGFAGIKSDGTYGIDKPLPPGYKPKIVASSSVDSLQ